MSKILWKRPIFNGLRFSKFPICFLTIAKIFSKDYLHEAPRRFFGKAIQNIFRPCNKVFFQDVQNIRYFPVFYKIFSVILQFSNHFFLRCPQIYLGFPQKNTTKIN